MTKRDWEVIMHALAEAYLRGDDRQVADTFAKTTRFMRENGWLPGAADPEEDE